MFLAMVPGVVMADPEVAAPTPSTEPASAAPQASAPEAIAAPIVDPVAEPEQPAPPSGWGSTTSWAGGGDARIFDAKIYGFIDSYFEKTAETPEGVDENGKTVWEENASEFDVANFNVMIQGSISQTYRFLLNFASPGSGGHAGDEALGVRNAWVEAPPAGRYLSLRSGKLYRRFGLYNEILDASPTFIGIEPPGIFDKDQPHASRLRGRRRQHLDVKRVDRPGRARRHRSARRGRPLPGLRWPRTATRSWAATRSSRRAASRCKPSTGARLTTRSATPRPSQRSPTSG
ncbi:MAG: hypothetical protein EXR76_13365 [Myxococcales bacterium]|nr:hypothetical protein [Myxococcales bacterium]